MFSNRVDFVGDHSMCVAMDGYRVFGIVCLYETEELAVGLIDPVPEILDAVLVLGLKVLLMRGGDGFRRHSTLYFVRVHE